VKGSSSSRAVQEAPAQPKIQQMSMSQCYLIAKKEKTKLMTYKYLINTTIHLHTLHDIQNSILNAWQFTE